jgi:hypothetical protein
MSFIHNSSPLIFKLSAQQLDTLAPIHHVRHSNEHAPSDVEELGCHGNHLRRRAQMLEHMGENDGIEAELRKFWGQSLFYIAYPNPL